MHFLVGSESRVVTICPGMLMTVGVIMTVGSTALLKHVDYSPIAVSVSPRNTSSKHWSGRSLHTSYSDLCSEHHGIVCCTEPLTQSSPSMLKSSACTLMHLASAR